MDTNGPTILTKTARDGRTIEIFEIETSTGPSCRARVNGETLPGYGGPVGLLTPRDGAVAYIPTKPAIGLTADEAAVITERWAVRRAAERAAFDASPAGALAALRRERERLADVVADKIEQMDTTFERMHGEEDALAWHVKSLSETDIDTARAAVRAFDAEHPEVLAAIKAERDAEFARSYFARGLD